MSTNNKLSELIFDELVFDDACFHFEAIIAFQLMSRF